MKSIARLILALAAVIGMCIAIPSEARAVTLDDCFKQYDYHGSHIGSVKSINDYLDRICERADRLKLGRKYRQMIKEAQDILEDVDADNPMLVKHTDKLFSEPYYEMTSSYDEYVYLGKTKNNRPHGKGILFTPLGMGEVYIGEFKNGQCHGDNIMISGLDSELLDSEYNLVRYCKIGEWKEGKLNGECATFAREMDGMGPDPSQDEFVDVAEYKKGEYNGNRKVYLPNDTLIKDVTMKNNKMNGKGKTYFQSGELEYNGEFKNGKRHGKGKLYDKSGELIYSGKFKNGDHSS